MYGRITQSGYDLGLPSACQLNNGAWVSNYNQLPLATLAAEGWLEIIEVNAEYNANAQTRAIDSVAEGTGEYAGKLVVTYAVTDLTEEQIALAAKRAEVELLIDGDTCALPTELQNICISNNLANDSVMALCEMLIEYDPEYFGA